HLGKFDGKVDEGFLVGYSVNSKAFRVFNFRTRRVKENMHIKFLENKPTVAGRGPEWLFDIDSLTNSMNYEPVTAGNQTNNNAGIEINANAGKAGQEKAYDHEYILLPIMPSSTQSLDNKDAGEVPDKGDEGVSKGSGINDQEKTNSSTQDVDTAESSINTASTNINTGSLNINIVGSNDPSSGSVWLFDIDALTRTMNYESIAATLEDITYSDDDEDVGAEADFTNLETTITMDVKSAFLYETIKEEVYVCQPPGFEDLDYPDKVYKVFKALYGLHQAPRAWKFGLTDGKSACTPIDTEKPLLKDLDSEDVDVHTYRSMIGSLMYLTSSRPDIMFVVYACARFQVTPKASHLHAVKRIFRYLKGKPHLGLWYPRKSPFNLVAYSDSDYAGASLDRKSTAGGCQFLRCRLISWQCKKQTVVATSSTEAEYVAAASCCAQMLWIQNQLLDYGTYGNVEFHQIVDFLISSMIYYALTRMNDQYMFGVIDLDGDEVIVHDTDSEKEEQVAKVDEMEVNTAEPVTTAGEVVCDNPSNLGRDLFSKY
nr:uncharacterized mitochondrial protein AtMg00810-like [Tanacetum cinerariifolium]